MPWNMAVGAHFHVQHGTKTILLILPADGETSWLLLQSLVSLLSGSSVQPEHTILASSRWKVRSKNAKKGQASPLITATNSTHKLV